jgi:putative FmdB family regulatory protein
MPVYPQRCRECKLDFDLTCEISERDTLNVCPKCGKKSERDFARQVGVQISGFKPRWVDIKGDRIFVSTKEQMVSECNKRGALHMGYSYFDKEEGRDR